MMSKKVVSQTRPSGRFWAKTPHRPGKISAEQLEIQIACTSGGPGLRTSIDVATGPSQLLVIDCESHAVPAGDGAHLPNGRNPCRSNRGKLLTVVQVDPVRRGDVDQLLNIAAARRQDYAKYQPQFWRPAADAVDRQRDFFASLLDDAETFVVVAREGSSIRGFAVARLVAAPPVYDPGGPSCVVDDFAVADPAEWPTAGPALLDAIRDWAADHGATQIIVVTAMLDGLKRKQLEAAQLSPASEWWVGPVTPR